MRLLFEEAIKTSFNPPEDRLRKLNARVDNSKSARTTANLEAYPNQYDKAEELITFYTFTPLVLSLNKIGLVNRILSLAKVSPYEENVVDIALERQYKSSKGYLKWIKDEVKNHPVKYIRDQANTHKSNQPSESNTHVDAFIETDKLLIFFEIKLTSTNVVTSLPIVWLGHLFKVQKVDDPNPIHPTSNKRGYWQRKIRMI